MAKMTRRERQFENNLMWILGGYDNGRQDEPEIYVNMTEDEWWTYVMQEMYDIKSSGHGLCLFGDGICKDLRFLGNDYMRSRILEEVHNEGWVEE